MGDGAGKCDNELTGPTLLRDNEPPIHLAFSRAALVLSSTRDVRRKRDAHPPSCRGPVPHSSLALNTYHQQLPLAISNFPVPLLTLDHISHRLRPSAAARRRVAADRARERVSIIGRNGAGKSTLLQILSGEVPPDRGRVWRQPALRVARLVQDVPLTSDAVGVRGGRRGARLASRGHDAEDWRREHKVDLSCRGSTWTASARVDTLSGGWRRRVLLARALVARARRCCCSTSRPTISTSTRSPGSRLSRRLPRAPSCSSRTTARFCSGWPRASSRSIAAG